MDSSEGNLTLEPKQPTTPLPAEDTPSADLGEPSKEAMFMAKYAQERSAGVSYREFRHPQWDDNKALYDDVVPFNRLVQRQPVNIPIMRETISTLLSKIDDPQDIRWENRDGGPEAKDREIVISEMWADAGRINNFEQVDYTGKKSVQLYGRCIKKHTVGNVECEDGKVRRMYQVGVLDVFDFLVDPRVVPGRLQTARFCTHVNIKRRLTEILASNEYDDDAKRRLIVSLDNPSGADSTHGSIVPGEAGETWAAKQERLRNLDISDISSFNAADVEVDLDEHYSELWQGKKYVRHVGLVANQSVLLQLRTLRKAIGFERWPFTSWTDDPDALIFWNQGVGDMIRTPNQVLNVFYSQWLENRSLRNFGMMWYDPSDPEFVPSTYTPEPFGMYPAPKVFDETGKATKPIQQVIMPIQVPSLDDSQNIIQFITGMVERATAATAVEKGVGERGQQTLGEIEALLAESQKRTISSAKFYRREWEESAQMFYDLMAGAVMSGQTVTYFRKNASGEYVPNDVKRDDWASDRGYRIVATSATEQDAKSTKKIRGLLAAQKVYPENAELNKVLQKRLLQYADVTGEEMKAIQDFEEKKQAAPAPTPGGPAPEQVSAANEIIGKGRAIQQAMAEMP